MPKEVLEHLQQLLIDKTKREHPDLWSAAPGPPSIEFAQDGATISFFLPRVPDARSAEAVKVITLVYYLKYIKRKHVWIEHID